MQVAARYVSAIIVMPNIDQATVRITSVARKSFSSRLRPKYTILYEAIRISHSGQLTVKRSEVLEVRLTNSHLSKCIAGNITTSPDVVKS
jgi:hypothetical protein